MPANQPFAEYVSIPTATPNQPLARMASLPKPSLPSSQLHPCALSGSSGSNLLSPPCLLVAVAHGPAASDPRPRRGSAHDPGVCGHPETAHGGVLATVLDEAMSLGVTLYAPEAGEQQNPDPVRTVHAAGGSASESRRRIRSKMFTAQLDVRDKKPVSVPGETQARVQVLAKQGKKVWVRAQIVQCDETVVDAMAFWLLTAPSGKSVL